MKNEKKTAMKTKKKKDEEEEDEERSDGSGDNYGDKNDVMVTNKLVMVMVIAIVYCDQIIIVTNRYCGQIMIVTNKYCNQIIIVTNKYCDQIIIVTNRYCDQIIIVTNRYCDQIMIVTKKYCDQIIIVTNRYCDQIIIVTNRYCDQIMIVTNKYCDQIIIVTNKYCDQIIIVTNKYCDQVIIVTNKYCDQIIIVTNRYCDQIIIVTNRYCDQIIIMTNKYCDQIIIVTNRLLERFGYVNNVTVLVLMVVVVGVEVVLFNDAFDCRDYSESKFIMGDKYSIQYERNPGKTREFYLKQVTQESVGDGSAARQRAKRINSRHEYLRVCTLPFVAFVYERTQHPIRSIKRDKDRKREYSAPGSFMVTAFNVSSLQFGYFLLMNDEAVVCATVKFHASQELWTRVRNHIGSEYLCCQCGVMCCLYALC
ncbi:hypothetical protein ANN_05526 [Periplaneta americana]|uniref:Uncharacterized protein n=1 Tax=Periplaneta americana TaxID=6978 RepID=A0ABQ8TCV2_PERAM|nr:hypothetical protein ANN_05526 [Periplaneta americana]